MMKRNFISAAALLALMTGLGVYSINDTTGETRKPASETDLKLGQEVIAPNEESEFMSFVNEINSIQSKNAKETGGGSVHRGFHAKTHACIRGELRISSDSEVEAELAQANEVLEDQRSIFAKVFSENEATSLDKIGIHSVKDFRYGIFSQEKKSYPVWVRYSNASGAIQSDKKSDARGMAIKVMSVAGQKILEHSENAMTQDFLMTNKPRGTTDNAKTFMEFAQATSPGGNLLEFFTKHPEVNKFEGAILIAEASKQKGLSLFNKQYWSGVPILLGERAIKFNVTPCEKLHEDTNFEKSDSLFRQDLDEQLTKADVCFNFNIQFQTDVTKTPIEHALTEWRESDSPSIKVAQIILHQLTLGHGLSADDEVCETLAFNPWHALVEHRPLGNMNRARLYVYKASQDARHAAAAEPKDF